ncbi:unnamed protein product, partial [Meganyctiphanes norvegica]
MGFIICKSLCNSRKRKNLTLVMSEPIAKEEFGAVFAQQISFYNVENRNNSDIDNELKHRNEICIKTEEDEIKSKEIEIDKELLSFAGKTYHCTQWEKPLSKNRLVGKSHQCSQCNKEFSTNGDLIEHKKTHTGEKNYQCGHYDMGLLHTYVIEHQRKHAEEIPYQCNQFEKAFSDKRDIIEHQVTHNREKPYQCSQCDKAFSQNGNLLNHQRTHTGDKPYQCSQCN